MDKSTVCKHSPDSLLEDMDGELLLYNPNNATTMHLSGSSTIVWELCDGENSIQDIIDIVNEAFPDQDEKNENNVVTVVKDLLERNALQFVDAK